jgi:hypothetical protein
VARYAPVALLKRVLYVQALVATITAIGLVAFPGFLLETILGQPRYPDYAWVRLVGVQAIALSLLIVLVAQRIEELWWWSWAFVVVAFGTAAVTTLHALVGLPTGAETWPWWGLGLFSWLITFGLLRGIAQAGAQSPPT